MMTGASFAFVGFGIVVALLVALRRSLAWRQAVLLAASVVFLATLSRDPLAYLPLLGFLGAGYLAVRAAGARSARLVPILVVGVVLLFVWIKRYAFVPHGLWIPYAYVTVGLSYMLFRLLHLVIEAHDTPALARLPVRDFLGYLIGFNTLVAGPIMFYDEYLETQRTLGEPVTEQDVGAGLERIVVGLFKTNVLAALVAAERVSALRILPESGAAPDQLRAAIAIFALYPIFLYLNFSGYIDIVIGLSRLLGQRLPENFDRPFSAAGPIEFWNRWHITLSRWLKTYVFNPLLVALMRRFPGKQLETLWATLAFFVTFMLVGVWHGQTTAFLVFGVLQGLGVVVNKLHQVAMTRLLGRKRYGALAKRGAYRGVARGLNYTWFAFTLTWFWGSWSEAAAIWSTMGPKRWFAVWVAIVVGSACVLALWEQVRSRPAPRWVSGPGLVPLRTRTAWLTTLFVVVALTVWLSTSDAPAIVYRDF
jgi:D-alanyl-lipoteichoic acid acyltransferase DltB (MBOAT superfamily)